MAAGTRTSGTDDGRGKIYIYPGRHSTRWDDSVLDFSDALVIEGSENAGIGSWLVADTENGTTLYTSSGADAYQTIDTSGLFAASDDFGPEEPAPLSGEPLSGGGFGCSLNFHHEAARPRASEVR